MHPSWNITLWNEETLKSLNLKYRIRIANYMFGGEAEHPFLRRLMDAMAERSTIKVSSQQEILDVTGPGHDVTFFNMPQKPHGVKWI